MRILACDLSMRRPGFAVLKYDENEKTVSVLETSHLDNRDKNKRHPEILSEIATWMRLLNDAYPDAVLVREGALAMVGRSAKTIQVLHKVVGVADLCGWNLWHKEFEEVQPKTVKRILTGDANAEKDAVAEALAPYVGKVSYACDDESDAVAVGVVWLIRNGLLDPKEETTK